nr:MAG TPA: hypothetical protein [Caudoviricetes sp.]
MIKRSKPPKRLGLVLVDTRAAEFREERRRAA